MSALAEIAGALRRAAELPINAADHDVLLRAARLFRPIEASCKRHAWMNEQQTGHSYCHLCGKHRKRQRV